MPMDVKTRLLRYEPFKTALARLPVTKPHVIAKKFGADQYGIVPEVHAWCTALCEDPGFIYGRNMAVLARCSKSEIPALVDPVAWAHLDARFWFRDPDHALAFKLRWC